MSSAPKLRKSRKKPPASGFEEIVPGQKRLIGRWLHDVRIGVPFPIAPLCEARGFATRHIGGKLRIENLADPKTGETINPETGEPPLYIVAPRSFPGEAETVLSDASDFTATVIELVPLLCDASFTKMEKLLTTCFRNYRPTAKPFYAARAAGREGIGVLTEDVIEEVLPRQHDGAIELCRADAIDLAAATERLRAGKLPYKTVRITAKGEVAELGWHGQKPTAQEKRDYERVKRSEDARKRIEIEREVEDLRAQRLSDAGLR